MESAFGVQKVRSDIQAGAFGKLVMGTVRLRWCRPQSYYDRDAWRGTWAMDGGALTNQGIHYIDLLQYLMGDAVTVYPVMADPPLLVGALKLTVSGTVGVNGAHDLIAAPGLTAGTPFTLLNKTSAGAITGTFTGKPQNSVFADDGYNWIVSYTGGDGNDMTLTIATPIEAWRYQTLGAINNSGLNADTADKDGDGVLNLMEYATAMNPAASDMVPQSAAMNGNVLDFTYTKNKSATDVTYTVEWSDTLTAASWSTSGVSAPTILSDNGTTQQIKVTVTAGSGVTKRFVHLKVTRP